ncbi:YbhB/YbcL family Raf kinase inhibitor-like protein [Ketobacter sp. MCCC 1A13808]|uniref:YbhB/YbcL family Raf kinase inhibitor-like protein n=1 Tax=Ketobacter sp. MCCC 1A13808 TaxID=2602738 RepID=UPI000F24717F|nr:YbhB/YbcL family Raf kinase inhibitor-like protein [Ketobacter sp. MCCC 1A13808]MVF13580.1 YbhB/YbcL family Raf kinase inhibitor-like protein [Ketobacter sp. MCCC 1A13808]RLP53315.1 MAG: YbhB/YbcL family Raf kinase inhibitor-like protein [Ketobacter sp.]
MGLALSSLQIQSNAFNDGDNIPVRYTHFGDDISPQLEWHSLPKEARSLVLFCHDPDAPKIVPGYYGFLHWLVYNIPADVNGMEEGCSLYTQAANDFGAIGYGGPKPPENHGIHRYYFWLVALDLPPELPPIMEFENLFKVIEPNVVGMNRLTGLFQHTKS